jgi:hypothetical protein
VDEDVIEGKSDVKTFPLDLQTLSEDAAPAAEEPPMQIQASGSA